MSDFKKTIKEAFSEYTDQILSLYELEEINDDIYAHHFSDLPSDWRASDLLDFAFAKQWVVSVKSGYIIKVAKVKQDCECGGDKLNLPHSDWCPKY